MRRIFLPVGMIVPPKRPKDDMFTVIDVDGFRDRVGRGRPTRRRKASRPPSSRRKSRVASTASASVPGLLDVRGPSRAHRRETLRQRHQQHSAPQRWPALVGRFHRLGHRAGEQPHPARIPRSEEAGARTRFFIATPGILVAASMAAQFGAPTRPPMATVAPAPVKPVFPEPTMPPPGEPLSATRPRRCGRATRPPSPSRPTRVGGRHRRRALCLGEPPRRPGPGLGADAQDLPSCRHARPAGRANQDMFTVLDVDGFRDMFRQGMAAAKQRGETNALRDRSRPAARLLRQRLPGLSRPTNPAAHPPTKSPSREASTASSC